MVKMNTPVRLLLSPKVLSPKSPIGKALNVSKNYVSNSCENFRKKLDFAKSLSFHPKPAKHEIKITVSDFDDSKKDNAKNILLINTPKKIQILKNGLDENGNLNVLGKGSFGTVIKGCYENRNVAVKVIKLEKSSKLRELNVMNFNHENVVKIIDVVTNQNQNYAIIVMEYLGFSRHLQNVLDDVHFSLDDCKIKKFAMDVCHGLTYCHKNGILHLDVKPKNILVCLDEICKLCDFGNSYKINQETNYVHQGTVVYTAPEILLGKTPTIKSDVYSFGVLLWQMISREVPYQNLEHRDIVIYKVVKSGLRPNSVNGDCDGTFASIYTKCWTSNPEDRPDTYSVIESLNQA